MFSKHHLSPRAKRHETHGSAQKPLQENATTPATASTLSLDAHCSIETRRTRRCRSGLGKAYHSSGATKERTFESMRTKQNLNFTRQKNYI